MILNAGSLSDGDVIEADLCIVGGGAAGISIALRLRDTGIRVVVLESGFDTFDERAQSLYEGENLGIAADPLDEARLRMLGGSTNHWGGNCMPLDPIDFEARPGLPHSGWPITRADLDPYYGDAQALVETPHETPYDTRANLAATGQARLPFDDGKLTSFLYAESPPTLFGLVYEDALRAAGNVRVYLNATALEIETDATATTATGVSVAAIDGPRFRVEARQIVLAQGGTEVPRLLLLSNSVAPKGLGNQNDLVGRFFMDHMSFRPALEAMVPRDSRDFDLYTRAHPVSDGWLRGALRGSDALLRAEQMPNFRFIFFRADRGSPGQKSAQTIKRRLERGEAPDNLGWHLGNILTDLDGVTNEVYATLFDPEDDLVRRSWIKAWLSVESLPNPDSRVVLTEARDDVFGQPRIGLDWRLTQADLDANRKATEVLAAELARMGYGRSWSTLFRKDFDWPSPATYGKHHSGTARMAADPRHGVVDADCRVHGMSNLYVAGSAVFPTQGHATPTLTIVALALRLADHLKSRITEGNR